MVRPVKGGFIVTSKDGKPLSKVYKSRGEAVKRLAEIEYFKTQGAK